MISLYIRRKAADTGEKAPLKTQDNVSGSLLSNYCQSGKEHQTMCFYMCICDTVSDSL